MSRPILCLDFDGVWHSYPEKPKYKPDLVGGPPTPGADEAIKLYLEHFDVQVLSSRTHQAGGMEAMQQWVTTHHGHELASQIGWPVVKPPAMITLDDRALTFTGVWPSVAELKRFRPWNRAQSWPEPTEPGFYWANHHSRFRGWEPVWVIFPKGQLQSKPYAHRFDFEGTWPLQVFDWGPKLERSVALP